MTPNNFIDFIGGIPLGIICGVPLAVGVIILSDRVTGKGKR